MIEYRMLIAPRCDRSRTDVPEISHRGAVSVGAIPVGESRVGRPARGSSPRPLEGRSGGPQGKVGHGGDDGDEWPSDDGLVFLGRALRGRRSRRRRSGRAIARTEPRRLGVPGPAPSRSHRWCRDRERISRTGPTSAKPDTTPPLPQRQRPPASRVSPGGGRFSFLPGRVAVGKSNAVSPDCRSYSTSPLTSPSTGSVKISRPLPNLPSQPLRISSGDPGRIASHQGSVNVEAFRRLLTQVQLDAGRLVGRLPCTPRRPGTTVLGHPPGGLARFLTDFTHSRSPRHGVVVLIERTSNIPPRLAWWDVALFGPATSPT